MKLFDSKLAYRAWYYFRLGYSVYLVFIFGYVSTLVTVYYLAIKSVPALLDLFPRFVPFAVLATLVGVPLAVLVGWLHLKRTAGFSSEQDINTEANPYNYKLTPGIATEVTYPLALLQLRILKRLAETSGALQESERAQLEGVEARLQTLLQGGYVGSPRRRPNF